MRATPILPLLVGLLTAGVLSLALAANPRVTLKLESVTCPEALDALARATGVTIDLQGVQRSVRPPAGRASGPQAKLNERASFQWTNAPLGRVVRDLCGQYNLRFQQFGGQYMVLPGPSIGARVGAAPAKPRFLLERDGFRLYATAVSTNSQRGLNLETGENRSNGESLTLTFKVEWPEGEPESLVGFESVAARDELGNVLLWRPPIGNVSFPQMGTVYPDEWLGTMQFLDAQPRARKLAWLEGELMVYSVFSSHSLELPTAGVALPIRGKLAGTSLELVRIDAPNTDAGSIRERGPTVITRLHTPVEEGEVFPDRNRQIRVALVGASGTIYPGRAGNTAARSQDGQAIQEMETQFPPIPEAISKIVYRTIEKREPRRLVSFRFENIPIPPADILPPAVALPVPLGFKQPANGPFSVEGGVNLQLRTELKGRPAPPGMLSVGLARREATGWSSIRWQETEVELGGVSRLRGLQPGKYRLLRSYRPQIAVDPGGDGHWDGGELEIEVAAGKEPALAPLRWVPTQPAPKTMPKSRPGLKTNKLTPAAPGVRSR